MHFVTCFDLLFRSIDLSVCRIPSIYLTHKLQRDRVPLYGLARVALDHVIEISALFLTLTEQNPDSKSFAEVLYILRHAPHTASPAD